MHRTALAASAVAALALLTACGEPARGVTDSGDLQAQYVDLPDGRVVICVKGDTTTGWTTGLTCDWDHAALEGEPTTPTIERSTT